MKTIVDYINESMSPDIEAKISKLIASKLGKIGGYEALEEKLFKGEEMDPKFVKILDKYDEYMEDVMWLSVDDNKSCNDIAKEIKRMAEDNESKTGTESVNALYFLEDLCKFLGL
jgi:hypothetical protein